MTDEQLALLSMNTIRTLSIDAVQQAKSGHPGTPMALAPLVYTLWNRVRTYSSASQWKTGDQRPRRCTSCPLSGFATSGLGHPTCRSLHFVRSTG